MDTILEPRDLSAELTQLLLEDHDISDVLKTVAELAAQQLSTDREVLCGIILKRAKRNTVVATSSAEAQQMDEHQAGFDEGPCLEAQKTSRVISVPDVRNEGRWPQYMTEVRDHGLRSILAVPLTIDATSTAAMNFYAHETEAFHEAEIDTAKRYTEVASQMVAIALRMARYADDAEDRRIAMESRTVIDLAVGIIMGQNRCSQQQAVEILKTASNNRNIKLRDLAEQITTAVGQDAPTTSFEP
ncbi:GAF and ANTAR domain-containing protein [Nesterenkonia lutea]|uniref:Transcriptional regulator with GAF, ATPase, and Fis domain n=1 Tax=Nesterenkonia lutea TaxID=272919 RepID=A0ABR9JCA8_9MICC|nr:GAF and ANTAR domain-containing protein [Nesterenkonia lutea]MBE1523425.1 transcriptional regulator with GAF, ATPase, and Fis domain [Nesterenkonia lutea]